MLPVLTIKGFTKTHTNDFSKEKTEKTKLLERFALLEKERERERERGEHNSLNLKITLKPFAIIAPKHPITSQLATTYVETLSSNTKRL